METHYIYMVHLAGCGALGLAPQPAKATINWHKLLHMAKEHCAASLVFCALKEKRPASCPPAVWADLEKTAWSQMLQNQMKSEAILQMLHHAEAAGLRPIVLKGMALAQSYGVPEARQALDTDLYIAPENEKQMLHFLTEQGFAILPRARSFYHSSCTHPQLGVVELHIDIFSQNARCLWLERLQPAEYISFKPHRVQTQQGDFATLAPASHMIYLCLHLLVHFIQVGVSLKMCLDVAAFYNRYKEEIDMEKVEQALALCGGLALCTAVRDMLHLAGIPAVLVLFQSHAYRQDRAELLLQDLAQSGELGRNKLLVRQLARNRMIKKKTMFKQGVLVYAVDRAKQQLGKVREYFFPSPQHLRFAYQNLPYRHAYGRHVRAKWTAYCARKKQIRLLGKTNIENREALLVSMGILASDEIL